MMVGRRSGSNGDGSAGGGMISGSGGVFLVLESADHAAKRGARAYAEVAGIESAQIRRDNADLTNTIRELILAANDGKKDPSYVVSAASGAHEATGAEKTALDALSTISRHIGLTGHLREAQFPLALALAAISVWKGGLLPWMHPKGCQWPNQRSNCHRSQATRAEGAAKLVSIR